MTTDDVLEIFASPEQQLAVHKLVASFKSFNFYGGDTSLNFLGSGDLSHSELQLLKQFMECWNSSSTTKTLTSRVDFLFNLWKKSLRIRFDHSLSNVEPTNER